MPPGTERVYSSFLPIKKVSNMPMDSIKNEDILGILFNHSDERCSSKISKKEKKTNRDNLDIIIYDVFVCVC